ncbi:hypothetical protein BDV93DRAFT_269853 [Ceratobasidium sp. AG-I]|nr:hypothetical protein BDV93DRAFT_269853 [Ceratobasidium sp. AG-I]
MDALHVSRDDNVPSPAALAFANFDSKWYSPAAMLNPPEFASPHPAPSYSYGAPTSPDNLIFDLDNVGEQPPQPQPQPLPRTGTLDWHQDPMSAYTNFDQLGYDESDLDRGNFCLTEPTFTGSPRSWDVGSAYAYIEPPLTPDSPAYSTVDSFGISPGMQPPFSPPSSLASSLPSEHPFVVGNTAARTRSSIRIPARRTNTHTHSQSFSSQLRSSTAHSPPTRPTLHMRAMSHSAAMHPRPTNLTMSPRTLRNSNLDAALAHETTQLHFHNVIATPYSTSAPSRPPAPIAIGNSGPEFTSEEIDADQAQGAGEEDPSRKRKHSLETERAADLAPPQRSRLNPPKQAPSTWQIFFTEYLQNYKVTNPERKLNVSQAAKDGGAAYKALSSAQKEIYQRKARQAKEEYERELAAWQRMLTPDDIRTENAFRSAQRKSGKSRRSNLKDPNAPKKPLSAYFMFLQWIRADHTRVVEVFGDETETTRQSVLAAAKWRTLSDSEKKPFLAQAEREKLEYEAARKEYEERTSGVSNPNTYTSGYMRMNGGSASSSSGWNHSSSADAEAGLQLNLGGRRSSSSRGRLAGGAMFGAMVFTPGPVFDEDVPADAVEGGVFGSIAWK